MNNVLQAKRIFVADVKSVLKMPTDVFDTSSCELVKTAYGYRLIYKVEDNLYTDILSGSIIKGVDSKNLEKNDLVVTTVRPLYRYSKSLRVCEYKKDVETYARYVAEAYNKSWFVRDNSNFYRINHLVQEIHKLSDENKKPLSIKEFISVFMNDTKNVEVDDLYVITTKIIDKVSKFGCEWHTYDYKLAVKTWNGKYIDPLTNTEIKPFSDFIKVGDIIIESTRPLYRYAKSLRIKEDKENVKLYAEFVKNKFNLKEYAENHDKFYEINELVRECHRKDINKEKDEERTK